ncbi:MAG TPA: hypothetical protein VHC22_34030 [Pirellulales bacterium]|nr:hypothetical protein [Pirellulales bacterium]
MMWEHGADPQMAIWWMLWLIKLGLWFLAGSWFLKWLLYVRSKRWALIVGLLPLLGWGVAISFASWKYAAGSRALADASNPATPAERLSQLVDFDGIQAGYELDNRLASNPNTSADALRKLSSRDQEGTNLCLARNPNTPADVLESLDKYRR